MKHMAFINGSAQTSDVLGDAHAHLYSSLKVLCAPRIIP